MQPTRAPELESPLHDPSSPYDGMKLVEAYFRTFADANIRVGLTLRPQQLELGNATDCHLSEDLRNSCQPFLTDNVLMTKLLLQRIDYAKKRWGVSILYVDSNVVADQYWKCAPWDARTPRYAPTPCSSRVCEAAWDPARLTRQYGRR